MAEVKTNETFKILYALGIIFIVAVHCINLDAISLFDDWFPGWAVNIGVFIFASGYFYSHKKEDNIIKYLVDKFKKFIIPLYIYDFVYMFIVLFIQNFGFFPTVHYRPSLFLELQIINGLNVPFVYPGWFIIPLFMTLTYHIILRKLLHKFKININEMWYFGFHLGLGVLGVYLANKGINHGWGLLLTRLLYFIPIYSLGILYKKYEKYDKLPNIPYFLILIAIQLCILYHNKGILTFTPALSDYPKGIIWYPMLMNIICIAFWLRVAKILTPILGGNKYMRLIADNTYSIMMNHPCGLFLLNLFYMTLYKFTSLCQGFDIETFHRLPTAYPYLPKGILQFEILYLFAGLSFGVFVQLAINKCKLMLKSAKNIKVNK